MTNKVEILDKNTTIEVKDASHVYNNFKTLIFVEGTSSTEIDISDPNFEDLGSKMFPNGLIPEDYDQKVDMINKLLEELSPIIDMADTGYFIKKVVHNQEADELYFESEEI